LPASSARKPRKYDKKHAGPAENLHSREKME
jgi:hypothetical protein